MDWRGGKISPHYFRVILGAAVLGLAGFGIAKIYHIQSMKNEIVRLETKLGKGQEVWRDYPPLTPAERRDLQRSQERLFRMLPKDKDKDIPSLLQEVSRLARDYNLSEVSFNTGDGAATPGGGQKAAPEAGQTVVPGGAAPQAVVVQPAPPAPAAVKESSGPIDSFPLKVTFSGDYREVAHFLEALQKLPRLVTIQSLKVQRAVPEVVVELVLHTYYQKGELPVGRK